MDKEKKQGVPYNFESSSAEGRSIATSVMAEPLKQWVSNVLMAIGVSKSDANIMSYVLTETDLLGVDTHGILKLPMYVKRAQHGGDNPKANLRILKESDTIAHADGEGGFGQIIGYKAMELAIEKAKKTDVGFVSVRNSNTLTANRIYTRLAAEEGFIGICITNGTPHMAPPGGLEKLLGTSPWSFAVPGRRFPVVIDIASTVVGWTKLALMAMRNEEIPDTWALNTKGEKTTDVNEAMNGLLLPAGGHKGYALSVMAEILTSILAGGKIANELGFYGDYAENSGISHLLGAIRIEAFTPLEEFLDRLDGYADLLGGSARKDNVDNIYLPGERSHYIREERLKNGIPLHASLAENLVAVGEELGVPFPQS